LGATKELLQLSNLADRLSSFFNAMFNEEIERQVLEEIKILTAKDDSVSTFEFLQSQIVSKLLTYLTNNFKGLINHFTSPFLTSFIFLIYFSKN
jgi:predicted PurR-regulated permease PerM